MFTVFLFDLINRDYLRQADIEIKAELGNSDKCSDGEKHPAEFPVKIISLMSHRVIHWAGKSVQT